MSIDQTRFLICLPYTLKEEGGNSNDPHDPGGRTHHGIIQREYDLWRRGRNLPLQSVYLATDSEVSQIYWTNYWLPYCVDMAPGVDLSFFDNCVNEGPRRATILLQQALRIQDDGIFGVNTDAALKAVTDHKSLIERYSDARYRFYKELGTYQYFGKGWDTRTSFIENASLAMVI